MTIDMALRHVVRRGLEATFDIRSSSKLVARSEDGGAEKVPVWVAMILSATVLLLVAILISVSYTIGHVVNNLTMIETPSEAITLENPRTDAEADANAKDPLAPTVTLVKPKPITSKIRTTLQHLKATAGFWSRWRGLGFAIIYSLAVDFVQSGFALFVGRAPSYALSYRQGSSVLLSSLLVVLTAVICAPLHMAWTHATIAMPSSKGLRARLPTRKQWKQLMLPAAALAVTEILGDQFMLFCQIVLGTPSSEEFTAFAAKTVLLVVAAIAFCLFITLPAEVTLTRIEASMLPDDEDSIVPFDRSFDGKVVPAILGGTGVVGFWEAWRSFKWEARWRLIKLNLKLFIIQVAIVLLGIHLIGFEIWAAMGKDGFKRVNDGLHGSGLSAFDA